MHVSLNLEKVSGYEVFLARDTSADGYIPVPRTVSAMNTFTEAAEENVTLMYGFDAARTPTASAQITWRARALAKAAMNVAEQSVATATAMIYLKNRQEPFESAGAKVEEARSVQNVLKTKAESLEQTIQQVHVEKKEMYEKFMEAEKVQKARMVEQIGKQLMEYSVEEESCAVMMQNRGTLAERAQSEWQDTVIGG